MNLMLGNATRDKNGIMICVSVSVKNQLNIAHVKIKLRILVHQSYDFMACHCMFTHPHMPDSLIAHLNPHNCKHKKFFVSSISFFDAISFHISLT